MFGQNFFLQFRIKQENHNLLLLFLSGQESNVPALFLDSLTKTCPIAEKKYFDVTVTSSQDELRWQLLGEISPWLHRHNALLGLFPLIPEFLNQSFPPTKWNETQEEQFCFKINFRFNILGVIFIWGSPFCDWNGSGFHSCVWPVAKHCTECFYWFCFCVSSLRLNWSIQPSSSIIVRRPMNVQTKSPVSSEISTNDLYETKRWRQVFQFLSSCYNIRNNVHLRKTNWKPGHFRMNVFQCNFTKSSKRVNKNHRHAKKWDIWFTNCSSKSTKRKECRNTASQKHHTSLIWLLLHLCLIFLTPGNFCPNVPRVEKLLPWWRWMRKWPDFQFAMPGTIVFSWQCMLPVFSCPDLFFETLYCNRKQEELFLSMAFS